MAYDSGDTLGVWNALRRKEQEMRWGSNPQSFGSEYDSLGRLVSASAKWPSDHMGRVARLRKALDKSAPLAQEILVRTLSGVSLQAIWPILVELCKDIALYYGGSVVAGGFIGGVGGAFFGGVGAIPGAAAGAAAGNVIGGWVLALLGLQSLVEELMKGIPTVLGSYEKGFLEAWGPTRQDSRHGLGSSVRGDSDLAAHHFADGHVFMVMVILTALVAFLTKGKGDKAALLAEISRSPRLGPKVAKWVEQHESQLRNHPALQSRKRGAGAGDPAPPSPQHGRKDSDETTAPRIIGMPQKKVPCFKTNDLPAHKFPEFDRQIAGQEKGLNNMTVNEYILGRKAFNDGVSQRDPDVARAARRKYEKELKNELLKRLRKESGMSGDAAKAAAAKRAADLMKTLAALHNPDMVAAGKDVISDFGDRNINSRIGAQWNKGERLAELDRAAEAVPASIRSTNLNVKLERCK